MAAESLRVLQPLDFVFTDKYVSGEKGPLQPMPVYRASVIVSSGSGSKLVETLMQKVLKHEEAFLEYYSPLHGLLERVPIVSISAGKADGRDILRGIDVDKIEIEVILTPDQLLTMSPDTDFSMGY